MLKESGLVIHPTGKIVVTPDHTYARYWSDFTENVSDIIDAQKKFRAEHEPTTLEFYKLEVVAEHEGAEVIKPVLIWEVNWVNGHATRFPNFREAQDERVPTHPITDSEYVVIYKAGEQ